MKKRYIRILLIFILISICTTGYSQTENANCPTPELCDEINAVYNQLLEKPGEPGLESIFLDKLKKSFYRYDCRAHAIWLCESLYLHYEIWIEHLSKMKSIEARQLFGSELFRDILDGESYQNFFRMSEETEFNLNHPNQLIEYDFEIFPYLNEDYYEEFVQGADEICKDINIEASSYLKDIGEFNYLPQNMIDIDLDTAWVEGEEGYGIGEKIKIIFKENIYIHGLLIKNGYTKDEKTWEKNSRVKTVIVSIDNKEKYRFHLIDTTEFQEVIFARTEFEAHESMEIEIEDVYKGTVYSDIAITELYPLIRF